MPVHRDRDSQGSYYQWGNHGKKYYYTCGNSESRNGAKAKCSKAAEAQSKAARQGRAIEWSKHSRK